jgi:spore coat protein H
MGMHLRALRPSLGCRFALCLPFVFLGCSSSSKAPAASSGAGAPLPAALDSGPPDSVYEATQRTEIRIVLSDSDWDALRHDGRTMAQQTAEVVPDYDYAEFSGTVSVDGVVYEGVELQKKGFLGSLSVLRPSLRLDFERGGVPLGSGLRRLTLNAALQDRSHARECMAFGLFTQAGLPAPRCSLSHVTVNGTDLGTYTNVEPIRKPMLQRHFADAEGNLYEGSLADFDEESSARVELETNTRQNDRSDVLRLVQALNASDADLVGALEPLIDLEQFRSFWALETLIGHWDGYAESANNYYAYHDPGSDRFVFIPWGVDQAFMGARPFPTRPYFPSVYAGAKLAERLYALPEQRELFRARLGELNDQLWDVDALLERTAAVARIARDVDLDAMTAHEDYLRSHGDLLRAALAEPAPAPDALEPLTPPPLRTCVGSRTITGEFEGIWQGEGASFLVDVDIDGQPLRAELFGTFDSDTANPRLATFNVFSTLDEERGLLLLLNVPEQLLLPGRYPFHAFETSGLVGLIGVGGAFTFIGFVGDGELELTRAAATPGAPVAGRFDAVLYQTACADPNNAGGQ